MKLPSKLPSGNFEKPENLDEAARRQAMQIQARQIQERPDKDVSHDKPKQRRVSKLSEDFKIKALGIISGASGIISGLFIETSPSSDPAAAFLQKVFAGAVTAVAIAGGLYLG